MVLREPLYCPQNHELGSVVTSCASRKGIDMTIRVDPENIEAHALADMANFSGKHVLEIGCGDGRVTWLYADKAARVTAIDPSAKQVALAREYLSGQLRDRVEFQDIGFEEFAAASASAAFDIVILSWSLC
jgi:2-polyprenyl-3-methyl-5-hydroxy-6-metoxy-1,4-benzoquinol methylase